MTTFTAANAATGVPVFKTDGRGALGVAYGYLLTTAEPVPADIYNMCKVPAGAVILGGWLRHGDIDTDASETMDIDVGYAANGDVVADPDAFGNFGVQTGDAITGYLPEGGVLLPFMGVLKDGPLTLTKETTITVTCVDDPATYTAGTISVVVFYVVP